MYTTHGILGLCQFSEEDEGMSETDSRGRWEKCSQPLALGHSNLKDQVEEEEWIRPASSRGVEVQLWPWFAGEMGGGGPTDDVGIYYAPISSANMAR